MKEWPLTLPNPIGYNCTLGDNTAKRETESGRRESVRYGSGAPDSWDMLFRLFKNSIGGNQYNIFKDFFNNDLVFGINWFEAYWITSLLSYPAHCGKIQGYPKETLSTPIYVDVSCTILIKKSSEVLDDVSWPPEGW